VGEGCEQLFPDDIGYDLTEGSFEV